MGTHKGKVFTILEVYVVAFLVRTLVIVGIERLFPRFITWQTETLGFAFPVFGDVVMMAIAITAALLWKKSPAAYGIDFSNLRYHLDIAGTCFLPVVIANMAFALQIDYTRWTGALILAPVQLALLFVVAWMLRKKPAPPAVQLAGIGTFMLLPLSAAETADPTFGKALALFLTYALFVGFGEEMLYRGYVQSRLNDAFGKPYTFMGVTFGWGAVLTALLFGLSHTGLTGSLLGLPVNVTLPWGVWTFFGGLVFGFVREKTGSIVAPALLHGLPQAIAVVAMLFL